MKGWQKGVQTVIFLICFAAINGCGVEVEPGRVNETSVAVETKLPTETSTVTPKKTPVAPPAPEKNYSFGLDREVVNVIWNDDGSLSLSYEFTFANDAFGSPIDFVDVSIPSRNYNLQDISAEVDGRPIYHITESTFVDGAVELGFGADAVPPGETGCITVRIDQIRDVILSDRADDSFASALFYPTWFAPEFAHGVTDLSVIFHLPHGVDSTDLLWHQAPPNWPMKPTIGVDEQGRITGTWTKPDANAHTQYLFGVSFPKAKAYVPGSSIKKLAQL